MRSAYQERLNSFAADLISMSETVRTILGLASAALLKQRPTKAEEAVKLFADLEDARQRCKNSAVSLLALEGPVARDLRQVVSSIYIVEDFDRMGSLAKHIAKTANRRYPSAVLPEEYQGYFKELARLCQNLMDKIHDLLEDPNADVALDIERDDDAVDDIHSHIMAKVTSDSWPHSSREAVDIALLGRFYERFADHTVNVAAQIVFLATGLNPDQYLEQRQGKKDQA